MKPSKKIAKLEMLACNRGGWIVSVYNTTGLEYVQLFDPTVNATTVAQTALEGRDFTKRFNVSINPPDVFVKNEVEEALKIR